MHELFCRSGGNNGSSSRPSVQAGGRDRTLAGSHFRATTSVAMKERRSVLRALLHWGADALQPDRNQGLSAMHYCAREDSADCMMELLSFLYAKNVKGKGDSEETLDISRAGGRKSGKMSALDREGCGPYFRCVNGRTCLHTAAASSAFETIDLLTRWDADNAILGCTRMALQLSRTGGSLEVTADSKHIEEYCLTTTRDCSGKIPAQLIGQSGWDESIVTFWERCYTGDVTR